MSACVPTTTSAWPDAIASSDLGLDVRLERAGQQRHADPDPLEQGADGLEVLARQQVGRGQERALQPGPGGHRQGVGRDRGLAGPDVALEEAEHRRRAGEVVADGVDGDGLVDGQLDRLADAPPDRVDDRRPDGGVRVGVDVDLRGSVADALSAPGHHAELERQELVEGQPAQRGVPTRERRRVVRLLDRPGDRHQVLRTGDLVGQVLRVGVAGLVERLADGGAQADRGQAGRQRVDRHDPAGVEQLGLAHLPGEDLELRVVQGQLPAEVLELAGHDDLGADREPPLDEATAEPGRVDRAGVVLEPGDRPLGPAAEARFDPDVTDRGLGGDDVAVGDEDQIAQLAHLAQVVVAPREVEEEVADGVEVELDARPAERRPGRQARLRERRRQQLDRVGRDRCRDRARRLGHAYSAAIRYR